MRNETNVELLRETMCAVMQRRTRPMTYHHAYHSVIAFAKSCVPGMTAEFSDIQDLGDQIKTKIINAKPTKEDIEATELVHTNNNKLLRDVLINLIQKFKINVYEAVNELKNILDGGNTKFQASYREQFKKAKINCMDTTHVFEKKQLDAVHIMITQLDKDPVEAFARVTGIHGDELDLLPTKVEWAKEKVIELANQLKLTGASLAKIKITAIEISKSAAESITINGTTYMTYYFDQFIIGSIFTAEFNNTLNQLSSPVSLPLVINSSDINSSTISTSVSHLIFNSTLNTVNSTLVKAATSVSESFYLAAIHHVTENHKNYAIGTVAVILLAIYCSPSLRNQIRNTGSVFNLFKCCTRTDSKKNDDINCNSKERVLLLHNKIRS